MLNLESRCNATRYGFIFSFFSIETSTKWHDERIGTKIVERINGWRAHDSIGKLIRVNIGKNGNEIFHCSWKKVTKVATFLHFRLLHTQATWLGDSVAFKAFCCGQFIIRGNTASGGSSLARSFGETMIHPRITRVSGAKLIVIS